MGEAFDRSGQFLGDAYAQTKREVFEKLMEKHPDAAEIRIRSLQDNGASTEMPRYKNADEVVPRGWMEDLHKAIFGRVDDDATYADVLHRVQWLAAQQDERNAAFLKSQASPSSVPVSPAQENTPQWRFACMCGVTWLPATAPDRCPECGRRADLICEHGNAVDMHCCNCHSGFIFDKDHECPELAQQPDYWRCRTCGCVWRDNHDDSVSLGGPTQKSCERCEMSPTAQECDPLYLAVSPAQTRETTQEQLQMLREALRLQAVSARSVTDMAGMSEAHKEFYRGKACGIEQASESVRLLLTASPGITEKDDPTKYWALRLAAAVKLNGEYFRRIQELEAQLAAPGITTPSEQEPLIEGARKVTDEELAPFRKSMEEDVIPAIVQATKERAQAAADARGKVIMHGPPETAEELRIALQTEQTLKAAWEKRAYEAEAALAKIAATPSEQERTMTSRILGTDSGVTAVAYDDTASLKEARELNINDHVWIKLRDKGRAMLREIDGRWSKLYATIYGRLATAEKQEAENDGWSRWQVWSLIESFGPAMGLGSDPPFETTIRLEPLSTQGSATSAVIAEIVKEMREAASLRRHNAWGEYAVPVEAAYVNQWADRLAALRAQEGR